MAKDNHSDSSHSFVDLMTSLMIIFILLLVATLNNMVPDETTPPPVEEKVVIEEKMPDPIKDLRKEVIEALEKLKLALTQDPDDPFTQSINLDEDKAKFELGKDALNPEGKDLIANLFGVLAPKLCDPNLRQNIESVIVEGHTDSTGNRTVDGKLRNIKLSQDRAYAVMTHAFSSLESKAPEQLECLRMIVMATGRGSTKLKESDAKSRRVEIKIKVKSASVFEQLEKALAAKRATPPAQPRKSHIIKAPASVEAAPGEVVFPGTK